MERDISQLKQQAAAAALKEVVDGMVLGLGSGSTTAIFVEMLGERINRGELKDIVVGHIAEWVGVVPGVEKLDAKYMPIGI